jgi:hypothetical protein
VDICLEVEITINVSEVIISLATVVSFCIERCIFTLRMNASKSTIHGHIFNGVIALIAVVILADFMVPGTVVREEVVGVKREVQDHHNAARGYHYSHRIITAQRAFFVAEDVAIQAKPGELIQYSVSRIFGEVNWCKTDGSNRRSYFSLRCLAALLIPLLTAFSMFAVRRFGGHFNLEIFVFVLQLILLVYLMILLLF